MLPRGSGNLADDVKKYLRDLAVATYDGKPTSLSDALVGADPRTLLWVCWSLDRIRAGAMTSEPFPAWPKLAATILDAARLRPQELIPQLACLVARESSEVEERGKRARRDELVMRYDFDANAAATLFGSTESILDVFATQQPSKWPGDGPVQAVFAAVHPRGTPPSS